MASSGTSISTAFRPVASRHGAQRSKWLGKGIEIARVFQDGCYAIRFMGPLVDAAFVDLMIEEIDRPTKMPGD